MIGLSHWFKRIRTSKEKESVTWNNPLFSLSSQGSLAFMTTEPMLLQVGLTMVPLVNYFSWFGQCNAGYFGLRYIHRLFLNFIVVSLDPQRVAQKPVEVLQGMTGWMPSTPLVMEGQIHCQDTDQVVTVTAAVTAILLRTEICHHQALVAAAAPPRTGFHQHHHRVDHLTGIRTWKKEKKTETDSFSGVWVPCSGTKSLLFY